MHVNFQSYPCSHCDKKCSAPQDLQHHVAIHHRGGEKPHKCPKCPKRFATKKRLTAHVKLVHSEHWVQCEVCGKQNKHRYWLKTHMLVHSKSNVKKATMKRGHLLDDVIEKEKNCTSQTFKEVTESNNTKVKKEDRSKNKRRFASAKRRYFLVKKFSAADPDSHKGKILKVFQELYENQSDLCQGCGRSFKNRQRLEVHKKKATCPGRKCHFCGKKFLIRDLKDHLVDNHLEKVKIYECQVCKKQFLHHLDYVGHERKHEQGGELIREEINLVDNHLEKVKTYECQVCKKQFLHHLDYVGHKRKHEQDGELIREKVPKQKLMSEEDLENHRVKIQKIFREFCDSKPNLCERCGFSAKKPHGLEVHRKLGKCLACRCKFCGMRFPFKERQQHLLDSHLAKMKIYECNICKKQFLQHGHLQAHRQMHKPDDAFTCTVCGVILKCKESLRTHKLLHFGKELECDYCDFKTVRKRSLTVHMRRHTSNPKFECKECGKHVATANTLHSHIQRMHVNFQSYPCSHCDKKCSAPQDLQHHVAIHHKGGEKPHKCPKCPKRFATKKRLTAHVNVLHSEHWVQCEVCGKQFKHRYLLKTHMLVHSKSNVKKTKR
ncbi:zinc finger protein 26-like isoform X1 [Ptychodera flava]|uniref:zinc finger protein 26-like isoform X1 n=1 Tax=Ptychodera flava TaxID=63121 RepID=UPI00396A1A45